MNIFCKKVTFIIRILLTTFLFNSCILDEFKFNEIKLEEDWGLDIVSPLFRGNFEFIDLINDDTPIFTEVGEKQSVLRLKSGNDTVVPTRIFFDPSTIIDSCNFFIQGNYSLDSISLRYTVSNACPFPLNLQMRFMESENPTINETPILPDPFPAAYYNDGHLIPGESIQILVLNEEQRISFCKGDVMEFTTWFEHSELINQQDTFLSNYPVEISIVLYGEVKTKHE
jgi:hypothetical protein